jgi:CheY-like chemotaxis protein
MRGTEKVLVVEDDDLVRAHAIQQLESLGYEVLAVENGPKAIEILRQTADFDLVFTDIIMPGGMNGRQLVEAAVALRPSLKVLYTSGYIEDTVIHHGHLDLGTHLLNKPYRLRDLAHKVRLVLSERN